MRIPTYLVQTHKSLGSLAIGSCAADILTLAPYHC